jgi:hypothetical protein
MTELVQAACKCAGDRCREIVLQELVAAGMQFAADFPDAPRPPAKVAP